MLQFQRKINMKTARVKRRAKILNTQERGRGSLADVDDVNQAAERRMDEPFILNHEKSEVSHESPEI
jgi:hypothetical protein